MLTDSISTTLDATNTASVFTLETIFPQSASCFVYASRYTVAMATVGHTRARVPVYGKFCNEARKNHVLFYSVAFLSGLLSLHGKKKPTVPCTTESTSGSYHSIQELDAAPKLRSGVAELAEEHTPDRLLLTQAVVVLFCGSDR